jgi:hypothetical protein
MITNKLKILINIFELYIYIRKHTLIMPFITFEHVPKGFDITFLIMVIMAIMPDGAAKFGVPSSGDEHLITFGGIRMTLEYRQSILELNAELIDGSNLSRAMAKKRKDQYEVFEAMVETIKMILEKYESEEIKSLLSEKNSTSKPETSSAASTSKAETSSADI